MEIFAECKDIKPFVRYAQMLKISPDNNWKNKKAYEYRLFYIFDGTGRIVIAENQYNLNKGDILIWPPNTEYSLGTTKDEFSIIGFNFDYTTNNNHLKMPIHPADSTNFDINNMHEKVVFKDNAFLNDVVYLSGMIMLEDILAYAYKEFVNSKILYEYKCSSLLSVILFEIIRIKKTFLYEKKNNNIDDIIHYLQQNYNTPIDNATIGKIFNYHPNYINKLMLKYTGVSLHKYLLRYRIIKAAEILSEKSLSVKEVCFKTGFTDFAYFSRYFKKTTGQSPSSYKNSI